MREDELGLRAFISEVMVGPCPRCASVNTHDCFYDEELDYQQDICELTKAIDDPTIGHCEDCGAVFCTECSEVIQGADKKPIDKIAKVTDQHSKKCPELQPERWAAKYGTIRRIINVDGDTVTISGPVEFDREDECYRLHLSKGCNLKLEDLKKKVGLYMRIDHDDKEIFGLAEIDDEPDIF